MTVSRWKNCEFFTDHKRKRKSKISIEIRNFIKTKARNKFTGINSASSRKLSSEIKRKFKQVISYGTINIWLRKLLKKPIKAKKTFYLRKKDKKRRLEFAQLIEEKKIMGKDIFFTDEKRFILNPPLNRQTNQIRLDLKVIMNIKVGKVNFLKK